MPSSAWIEPRLDDSLHQKLFQYRPSVLESLASHGIAPTPNTPPELVRDFVNDLYLIEIRSLRKRLKRGDFEKGEYAGRVDELRKRYPILALPLEFWTT